jgi:DNA repair photolyase
MESVEEVDVLVICGILSELRTTSTLFTPLWVCYARPAHAYLNLSPGLDFETRIFHKPALAAVLARELSAPGYRCRVLHVGGNTDPYQPAERSLRSTRALLELLLERRHPLTIITKGALILRDIDLYVALAERTRVSRTRSSGRSSRSRPRRGPACG